MPVDETFLKILPVACFMTDDAGFLTFFNDAAAQLWGDRPDLGRVAWQDACRLIHPDGHKASPDDGPIARVLETGQSLRRAEAMLERADGGRVAILLYVAPICDGGDRVSGTLALLVDVIDRTFEEIELERLAAVVASSDDAIVSKTLDGRITSWNAGATRIFGYTSEEMIGQPITRIIPPDLHDDEDAILARLRRGEHIEHFDTVRVAKDGSCLDISLTVSPLRDRFGAVVGASKVARDISERRRHDAAQRRLIHELDHRVKNTLAIVQALANQSLRRSVSPADFVASFNGRIQALAQVHDLLVQQKMLGVEVAALVREMVVRGSSDVRRILVAGPAILVTARAAVQLAMVFHELAANAHKHGALATSQGVVSITWTIRQPGRSMALVWRESGVEELSAPVGVGFGRSLVEDLLESLSGSAVHHFAADGLVCQITLPLLDDDEQFSEHTDRGRAGDDLAALSPMAREPS